MIIHLTAAAITVFEADDCTRLHVSTELSEPQLDEALRVSSAGRHASDGTALILLDVLRSRASAAASAQDWTEHWDEMIAHAARNGWLTEDGSAVQAHIETGRQVRA